MIDEFIAHHRSFDQKIQSVSNHLDEVSAICGRLAGKIGVAEAGSILGLLHDVGKYSQQFQAYIRSATGMLNPDLDDYVDSNALRGKIDHSTAGAQWIWQRLKRYGVQGKLVGQILAVCLASHHGGLIDCLKPGGENGFSNRINKDQGKTHLQECLENADDAVLNKLNDLATDKFLRKFWNKLVLLVVPEKNESETIKQFRLGFFLRFLFSCVIDADRIDSADFENPGNVRFRSKLPVDWQIAIDRLEAKLASFPVRNEIDTARREISDQCKKKAESSQGIYTLTVPTGGGKTFA
ncbi:MAG: CRISPR-associated endonuclease Cas3'', partial [Deltaproteobacteria bacterium]|nr:CRISPR-associated endonuclease Cas3'' [Deltaproteobacteria bacterium]